MSADLTVVIPSFNEAPNVQPLLTRLTRSLAGVNAEILYVDDSTDETPLLIREYGSAQKLPVRCLHREHPTGGLAGAVVAGLKAARSPYVVVMDADLQHPPETVIELYRKALLSDVDVVVASRYCSGGSTGGLSGGFRRFVSTLAGAAAKALFPRRLAGCSDPMSGFFALRREAVHLEGVTQCGYKILLALLLQGGRLSITEVPLVFAARQGGASKAGLREGWRYLRLLTVLRIGPGLLFTMVGAAGAVVNLVVLALLIHLKAHYIIASAIAVQVAILWNFAGAEVFVFRDRRIGRLWHRAVRYQLLSSTDLLRLPFVLLLVDSFRVGVISASAATLVVAVVLRYSLAARLIYKAPTNRLATAGRQTPSPEVLS